MEFGDNSRLTLVGASYKGKYGNHNKEVNFVNEISSSARVQFNCEY